MALNMRIEEAGDLAAATRKIIPFKFLHTTGITFANIVRLCPFF